MNQLLAEVLTQFILGYEERSSHAYLKRSGTNNPRLFEACVGSCGLYHRPGDQRLPNKAYDKLVAPSGGRTIPSIALHHHGDGVAPAEAYRHNATAPPGAL